MGDNPLSGISPHSLLLLLPLIPNSCPGFPWWWPVMWEPISSPCCFLSLLTEVNMGTRICASHSRISAITLFLFLFIYLLLQVWSSVYCLGDWFLWSCLWGFLICSGAGLNGFKVKTFRKSLIEICGPALLMRHPAIQPRSLSPWELSPDQVHPHPLLSRICLS